VTGPPRPQPPITPPPIRKPRWTGPPKAGDFGRAAGGRAGGAHHHDTFPAIVNPGRERTHAPGGSAHGLKTRPEGLKRWPFYPLAP